MAECIWTKEDIYDAISYLFPTSSGRLQLCFSSYFFLSYMLHFYVCRVYDSMGNKTNDSFALPSVFWLLTFRTLLQECHKYATRLAPALAVYKYNDRTLWQLV